MSDEGIASERTPEQEGHSVFSGKRFKRTFVLLLVCAIVVCAYPATCYLLAKNHQYQGLKAMDARAYIWAEERFSAAIYWAPSQIDSYGFLAGCYVQRGKFDEAIATIEAGALRDGEFMYSSGRIKVEALIGQAQEMVRQDSGKLQEALVLLEQGESVSETYLYTGDEPNSAFEINEILGRLQALKAMFYRQDPGLGGPGAEQTAWTRAEEYLGKAVANEPGDVDLNVEPDASEIADLYSMLASAQRALGRTAAEEKSLEGAVNADPRSIISWRELHRFALTHQRYGALRGALKQHTSELAQSTPPPTMLLCNLHIMEANVLENAQAEVEQIEAAYIAAIGFERDRVELWANFARYAQAHKRMKILAEAVYIYGEPVEGKGMLPQLFLAWQAMNGTPEAVEESSQQLLMRIQDYDPDEALTVEQAYSWTVTYFEQRLSEDETGHCLAYMNMGIIQNLRHKYAEANLWFSRAEPCISVDEKPDYAVHWSTALMHAGDMDAVGAVLEKAVKEFPDHFELRLAYARALLLLADKDAALIQYEYLLQAPDLSAALRTQIEMERGRLSPEAS